MQMCVFIASWCQPEKQSKRFPDSKGGGTPEYRNERKTCVLTVLAKINMAKF